MLGCGWLGFPLALSLLNDSYVVYGSTTSNDKTFKLKDAGIIPSVIKLNENGIEGDIHDFLNHLDILVIDVPPRLRGKNPESFVEKIKLLHGEIKKTSLRKIIFVSSTSVYGSEQGEVDEKTAPKPTTESGRQLLSCEQLLSNDVDLQTTIIRFGGLIGPDRHPVTMLSARENLSNGNDAVNLIHLDDCILLISTIIKEDYWGEIFNGVYPSHPPKEAYYTSEAKKRGIPAPKYSPSTSTLSGKVVIGRNFLNKGHTFKTSISL